MSRLSCWLRGHARRSMERGAVTVSSPLWLGVEHLEESGFVRRERLEGAVRLLFDSGDLTPTARRQLLALIDPESAS